MSITLKAWEGDEYGRVFRDDVNVLTGEPMRVYSYGSGMSRSEHDAMMVAVQKRLADALKPHCSRCDKAGPDCKSIEACRARSLKRSLRGCDSVRLHCVTLPMPPNEWVVARGYGAIDRSGWRLQVYTHVNQAAMKQHYAYDLAMGVSWDDEAELAA